MLLIKVILAQLITMTLSSDCDSIKIAMYMSSNHSVYLQIEMSENFAEKIIVFCQNMPIKQLLVSNHMSTHNAQAFRAYIGTSITDRTGCTLMINDNFYNAGSIGHVNLLNPYNFVGVPIKSPKIEFLSPNDSLNGIYNWSENDLVIDEGCESEYQKANFEIELNLNLRQFNLENLKETQNVYLILSTSPDRLLRLHYVLQCLDLTLIKEILIALPYKFRNSEEYSIPLKLIQKFPKIRFIAVNYDFGPITKLIVPVEYIKQLEGEKYKNDLFISIDDDIAYNINFVDTFIYYALHNPNSVVAASGLSSNYLQISEFGYPAYKKREINGGPGNPDFLCEGYAGVVYRGEHVDIELMRAMTRRDLNPEFSPCFLSDDLVISYALAYSNVQVVMIPKFIDKSFYGLNFQSDFPMGKDQNSLKFRLSDETIIDQNYHLPRYRMCFSVLVKYFLDFTKENIPFKPRKDVLEGIENSSYMFDT